MTFKFFNGHKKHSLYDELIKNYGLSPGIPKWIDRKSFEINYLEEDENLSLTAFKSINISIIAERYISYQHFMYCNRENLILLYCIIDNNGTAYTEESINFLDQTIPITLRVYIIGN